MIWFAVAGLAMLAAAVIAWPLIRGARGDVGRADSAMAILRDQLSEVSRDQDRGLLSPAEAQAAEVEIKRRMLTLSKEPQGVMARTGSGRVAVFAAALFVPVFAVALYLATGAPSVPSLAFAERAEEQAEAAEIAELSGRLRERLESDPQGGPSEGWALLAQVYTRMGRPADAAAAYAELLDRPDANSATFSLYAEALIEAEGGIVSPAADDALDRARDLDPRNPAATFYKTLALEQAGAWGEARDMLLARLDAADGFQPWMESFVGRANYLGEQIGAPPISLADYAPMMRGPDSEDMAAAADMTEEDRSAFIRSMVEGLAARLETNPDDLDGWLRLARAYTVLGEQQKARSAYEAAREAGRKLPDDDPRLVVIREALGG